MDNKQDKLDDFLRDQLNDSSENPSWNVPGDHVFENAINALPKKKKKIRRGWIFLPLLFLAVFFGREYFHMNEINQLENKITVLEETITTQSLTETNSKVAPKVVSTENFSAGETEVDKGITNNEFSANRTIPTEKEAQLQLSSNYTMSDDVVAIKERTTPAINTTNTAVDVSSIEKSKATNNPGSESNSTESLYSASSKSADDHASNNTVLNNSSLQIQNSSLVDAAQQWLTSMLISLPISGLDIMTSLPEIGLPGYSLIQTEKRSSKIYPWRFGLLAGGNQSWLTMKNIPESSTTRLYEYDNSQPGGGAYAFIEKPLTKKLVIQAGLGYQYYQNQSVLEDKFLFDEDKVMMMPGGEEVYQDPIEVINPLGDYSTMLGFRVSDEMQQNDIIREYTTMKQKLHTVHFDISISYKILSVHRFDVSLGAGLGLGYLAGLKNDFSISCYHNGELQSSQTESPKNLSDSQKWYGQAIGKMNIEYHLTDRSTLILESQYRSGISSLRRGTEANGSQTYIHALGLSVGLAHSF